MDFGAIPIDDEARAFWDEVSGVLEDLVTPEILEEDLRTGDVHSWPVHRALGERGWVFPDWPVEEGGAGLSPLLSQIFEHEYEAHQVPWVARGTTGLVLSAVRQWGQPAVRDDVLRRAARGEIVMALGYTEPDSGSDMAAARTRAVLDGDEWVVNGQKMFTTGAQNAAYAFTLVRTDPDVPKHKGLTMLLVPLNAPGVEIQRVDTLGDERTNMVFFDDVRVPDSHRLGPAGHGWAVVNGPLNAEHGMAEEGPKPVEEESGHQAMFEAPHARLLDRVVAWAGTPSPDGSRPIDDPQVRARLATVALHLEIARATPGPMGRIASAELFITDAGDLLDLVGPAGLVRRGEPGAIDDGWIERAYRFAQGTPTYGGTTEIFRNIIAEHFLGLPRAARPR
jgi:3-oxocholest-4-en-26-oyl-CoA dehydrogenase alpha subunit